MDIKDIKHLINLAEENTKEYSTIAKDIHDDEDKYLFLKETTKCKRKFLFLTRNIGTWYLRKNIDFIIKYSKNDIEILKFYFGYI
jgi:hypothetical protein